MVSGIWLYHVVSVDEVQDCVAAGPGENLVDSLGSWNDAGVPCPGDEATTLKVRSLDMGIYLL